jgi:hypothetical protein
LCPARSNLNQFEHETTRLYLLGKLDENKQAQIEERLLTDDTFYDELSIAEDELTDQYLANELSDEERRGFETHFLSAPERRQKLRFARSLRRYVSQATGTSAEENEEPLFARAGDTVKPRSKKRPFLSFLPIQNPAIAYSLVLLAVIGISWTVFNNLRPTPRKPGNILAVTLTPGLTRESGETKTIHIPPGTDSVQLQLELVSDEYQASRAELLTSEGASLFVKEDLKPESEIGKKIINLTVPAGLLKRDDYRVKLGGRRPDGSYEDIGGYAFRVLE